MKWERSIAIVAITRPGSILACRLQSTIAGSDLFLPTKLYAVAQQGIAFKEPVAQFIGRIFAGYQGLVLFMALGAACRILAPYLSSKRTDPAVVVVDDAGRYAVSLLSGHLGGANDLACYVAHVLGAQPVITTASDVLGTLPVDILGRDLGWELEDDAAVAVVSAAVVNGEPVGLYQEAGEEDWWPKGRPLPSNIQCVNSMQELSKGNFSAALIITDRMLSHTVDPLLPTVLYRPKSLVIGIGCHRGVSCLEVEEAISSVLQGAGLSRRSLRCLATIDVKRDEVGLLEFARQANVRIEFFGAEELGQARLLISPSQVVLRHMGVEGVCEPAALLAAGASRLLVPKRKWGNVTIAIARIRDGNLPAGISHGDFRHAGR